MVAIRSMLSSKGCYRRVLDRACCDSAITRRGREPPFVSLPSPNWLRDDPPERALRDPVAPPRLLRHGYRASSETRTPARSRLTISAHSSAAANRSPMAGNHAVDASCGVPPNGDGLEDSVLTDGVGKVSKRFLVHGPSRLLRIGLDLVQRNRLGLISKPRLPGARCSPIRNNEPLACCADSHLALERGACWSGRINGKRRVRSRSTQGAAGRDRCGCVGAGRPIALMFRLSHALMWMEVRPRDGQDNPR